MGDRRARKRLNKFCLNMRRNERFNNEICFKLIKEFKELYIKCKADKKYNGMFTHYRYFIRLVPIRQAFEKNDYSLALHELNTIIALDDIYQLRIRTSLIDLLNKYIH